MTCGIYKIENKINGKVYIGQSNNIFRRWMEHQRELIYGVHHSRKLQADFNKYGITAFLFEVLIECKKDDLYKFEGFYCEKYKALTEGYNHQGMYGLSSVKESDILNTNGAKFIISLDIFEKTNLKKSNLIRLIYLMMKLTSLDGKFYKKTKIEKGDIGKILKLPEREKQRFFQDLKDNNIFVDFKTQKIECEYIKRIYEITYSNMDYLIIYMDKFIEIYESGIDEKVFRDMLALYIYGAKHKNEISMLEAKKVLNNSVSYYKTVNKILKCNGTNDLIVKTNNTIYLSTLFGHGIDIIEGKVEFDSEFEKMKKKSH